MEHDIIINPEIHQQNRVKQSIIFCTRAMFVAIQLHSQDNYLCARIVAYFLVQEEIIMLILSSVGTLVGYTSARAHLGGGPVSVSTLLLDGKVAGVYSISTRKDIDSWEKIDTAVGRHPLMVAGSHGYRVGVAQTSEGGLERYRRYGFVEKKNLCYNSFFYSVE